MTGKQRKTLTDELNNLHDVCIRELSDLWIVKKSLDVLCELLDWGNMTNVKRDIEVKSGNFVHYIVDLDTNVRKSENGNPVIYSTIEAAEFDYSEEYDTVISIAEYNRRYGSFMED